jgi:hypothetical protein
MMFTDWTQTDAHYFCLRGAIMGCVLTLLVVMPIINELRKLIRRTANPPAAKGNDDD